MAGQDRQKKLTRVRPPRVQIYYDLEVGDAIELVELNLFRGVTGDSVNGDAGEIPAPVQSIEEADQNE